MPENTIKKQARQDLLENTREYKKIKRLQKIFIISVIGAAISFLQYYELIPSNYLPSQVMPLIKFWAAAGSVSLLLVSLFCYIGRYKLTNDILALEDFELGHSSSEKDKFNEINPNKAEESTSTPQEEVLLAEISRDSIIFMVISIVAIYIQSKNHAYHEIKPYFSWLTNFIS